MKKTSKQIAALWLSFVVLFSLTLPTRAVSRVRSAMEQSVRFVCRTASPPGTGSVGGEWAVLGAVRSGCRLPEGYIEAYAQAVEAHVKRCGGALHRQKYTEYSRVIIALTAIGRDPGDVAGYNLLIPLGDFEKTVWQGINGPIWALIALDCGGYDMPENTDARVQATRQMYVDAILEGQLPDGGWNLTGVGGADPDMTGMALQALARYQDQQAVRTATERALECLSGLQTPDGGFTVGDTATVESVAQVIVALCELGVDVNDSRFVKNGTTLVDSLFSFYQPDGSFCHSRTGSGDSQMASEQGLYALAALSRAEEGRSSLYHMSDAAASTGETANALPPAAAEMALRAGIFCGVNTALNFPPVRTAPGLWGDCAAVGAWTRSTAELEWLCP